MMKAAELANKLRDIAENYKTLYVYGAFGAHLRQDNYERYLKKYPYNAGSDRKSKIEKSLDKEVFGFDCVCLIKGVLWGWHGDLNAHYGGAAYESNGVPDIGANRMIGECLEVSEDFSHLEIGEFLWVQDHCGIYIGDGLAVECTPILRDGVQITALANIQNSSNIYNKRKWTKHGKLPWVDYSKEPTADETPIINNDPPESEDKIPSVDDETPVVDEEISVPEEIPETTPEKATSILAIISRIIRIIGKILSRKK